MKTYRCTHTVEAMRWTDTDADREAFATCFEARDQVFETRGPEVVLPTGDVAALGEWLLFMNAEFVTMAHEIFSEDYAEVS